MNGRSRYRIVCIVTTHPRRCGVGLPPFGLRHRELPVTVAVAVATLIVVSVAALAERVVWHLFAHRMLLGVEVEAARCFGPLRGRFLLRTSHHEHYIRI